jgi:hypothetical protein
MGRKHLHPADIAAFNSAMNFMRTKGKVLGKIAVGALGGVAIFNSAIDKGEKAKKNIEKVGDWVGK